MTEELSSKQIAAAQRQLKEIANPAYMSEQLITEVVTGEDDLYHTTGAFITYSGDIIHNLESDKIFSMALFLHQSLSVMNDPDKTFEGLGYIPNVLIPDTVLAYMRSPLTGLGGMQATFYEDSELFIHGIPDCDLSLTEIHIHGLDVDPTCKPYDKRTKWLPRVACSFHDRILSDICTNGRARIYGRMLSPIHPKFYPPRPEMRFLLTNPLKYAAIHP